MASAGTFGIPAFTIGVLPGYSSAAVIAGQNLLEFEAPCDCRLGGIQSNAQTAGTGAGSTTLDVLLNDTSIWTTPSDRPTLAAASVGDFTMAHPPGTRAILRGARVTLRVISIPAATGH